MARRSRLTHERRVLLLALLGGAVGVGVTLGLLLWGEYSSAVRWTLGTLVVLTWLGFAFAVQEAVVRPLQTLSNLLAALREEDFSFKARGTRGDDALSHALLEVNALADTLREQRLGALEAIALLRKVMEEVDVAVFAFDEEERLRLANRAGERLLARPPERLLGRTADELGLETALSLEAPGVHEMAFPGGMGRWEVRRGTFRQGGRPHRLLVLADVSRALREEERLAWRRLIRVLGHEMNNSLAPIRSIADSLQALVSREPRPADWEEDAQRGIAVIRDRSAALGRFMEAYSRLARLPPPKRAPVDLGALVRRVAGFESRLSVTVAEGPPVEVAADADQLEQLLINLVGNAVDAALETDGGVAVSWRRGGGAVRELQVWVEDEGPGLPSTTNLFVPFFTTKPGGSGIGLVLSRQIAEGHGGSLTLEDRADGPGCRAVLRLPAAGPAPSQT
jgi:nitrogen fixation/metabolism regulation signal transduction histidine kinase